MVRRLSTLLAISLAQMIVGAPGVGNTVRAAMERNTRHKKILSKQSEDCSSSQSLQAISTRGLIVGKVSIDVDCSVLCGDTAHLLLPRTRVKPRSIRHGRYNNFPGLQQIRDVLIVTEATDEHLNQVVGSVRSHSLIPVHRARDVDLNLIFGWRMNIGQRHYIQDAPIAITAVDLMLDTKHLF
jgi:hypothetical protein